MDSFLSINPGLIFWSIINFLFFLLALYLIGGKRFVQNINNREELIQKSIDEAEAQKNAMQKLVEENERKLREAHSAIDEEIKRAKDAAETQGQAIIAEAKKQKESILKDAQAEIQRSQAAAMNEIRSQVADIVVNATEKIINEKLDAEKDQKLVNTYIDQFANVNQLSKN
jgi:F-type H+-transporting ATPase subunit b